METGINFAIKTGMELLSFETAKRLKDAGFTQPDSLFGQMWYTKDGNILIAINFFSSIDHRENIIMFNPEEHYFAPTAAEILKELPEDHFLQHANGMFFISYYCDNGETVQHKGKNLLEVGAAAWLDINEK